MKMLVLIVALLITLRMEAQDVKWYTWEEAIEMNKKEPRKIMVDVYTDWCKYCKDMDRGTFSNKIIAEYLNKAYYPVKLNAEQRADITYKEYTYKFIPQGSRGFHELAYALLDGQLSYPSIVFLNEQVEILHIQKGFVAPVPFDEIIKFIGGSHYLSTSWTNWKKGYKSPFSAN